MSRPEILLLFASCRAERIGPLAEKLKELGPGQPLFVVSELPPPEGRWIPYNPARSLGYNLERCRYAIRGSRVAFSGVALDPNVPHLRLRAMAFLTAPLRLAIFNENFDHFMLRPRCAVPMAKHFYWRVRSWLHRQTHPGGEFYTFLWRLGHPSAFRRPLRYVAARAAGELAAWRKRGAGKAALPEPEPRQAGISVVVPSRNGRELLGCLLPGLLRELAGRRAEIIVVDNGSDDGTEEFLRAAYPEVRIETSAQPLSFARAVNRGIRLAKYSHVCLLNNDMIVQPGFFEPLVEAFGAVPELFCATAQIFLPEGLRREETGKAVMPPRRGRTDFPLRCDEPIPGENLSYVLYGSGGCSLYDAAKLAVLGGFGEIYEPAYVEDLDVGYRAWQRGWPSVFVADARVEHRHRATTSRYYSPEELERVIEVNYLRFLARAVASPALFRRMWRTATERLNLLAATPEEPRPAMEALQAARQAAGWVEAAPKPALREDHILAAGSGEIAVFPGRAARGRPVVLVASPYLPYPLSHGGAVRMYNLMSRAVHDYDQVLVCFTECLSAPPAELLAICSEVVLVRRTGSHARPLTGRPDVVEEFDSPVFHAALRLTMRKWKPFVAQLEFTQMAQYAADCRPARTVLVEHDVTVDLFEQLMRHSVDRELRRQYARWFDFERAAWRAVDRVVTMSPKDGARIEGGSAVVLPNGVDLERFRPCGQVREAGRLLFIGSFAHLPNVIAMDWFLREVWPRLAGLRPSLHIIAGANHRYYLGLCQDRMRLDLDREGIVVEDFVADVRPAYERAAVVIAPLQSSAGTNIKVLEAMAMEKAIVSTPAGVNGLDLRPGKDFLAARSGSEFAKAVALLLGDAARADELGRTARRTVEQSFGWDALAELQRRMYKELLDSRTDR